jgi:hypothetical protein
MSLNNLETKSTVLAFSQEFVMFQLQRVAL